MKFCTNCGAQLNDDDVFCYKCGTKCAPMVAEEPKAKEEPAPAVSPLEEPILEEKSIVEEEPIIEEEPAPSAEPILEEEPMIVEEPAEEPFLEEPEEDEEAKRQAEEEARRQAEEEEKRRAEEEAKRQAEEEAKRKAEEEARQKAEEEARRKAEEEARLAEERKEKEQRLADIEKERAQNKKQDASLREEENKLRADLSLPVKEEPKEVNEEAAPKKAKTFLVDDDEFNSPTLLFHSVIFFGILVGVSFIYWLIGAFTNIHVAIRVVLFFLSLGTLALPVLEIVKLVIYMIKNRKINLFLIIVLAIIQVLSWVFISVNFSAIFS